MTCKRTFKTLAASTSALCLATTLAQADIVHLDDVIIDGSLCVGQDCVNGESFGFDTIRLKENNTRIKFDDTSASASFPNHDWQLTANESNNGGLNKFSIEDTTAARIPFTIEGSAPTNSLYVDDGGRVGLGTSTPVVELHVVNGDSPTLRLEQNGSSGFQAQTWDVAGNETNFFVRDATNGSLLPFKIRPSAPTNSLYVNTDGNIGLGTASPDATLNLEKSGAAILVTDTNATVGDRNLIEMRNTGGMRIFFNNQNSGATSWVNSITSNGSEYRILPVGGDPDVFRLTSAGALTIAGAITTGGGTCGSGCDAVFDADYALPSIDEHAAQMWANGYLPNVGPTIEGEPINISDKLGRMLNELEKAHIYIDQLNNRLALLETSAE